MKKIVLTLGLIMIFALSNNIKAQSDGFFNYNNNSGIFEYRSEDTHTPKLPPVNTFEDHSASIRSVFIGRIRIMLSGKKKKRIKQNFISYVH